MREQGEEERRRVFDHSPFDLLISSSPVQIS
jgi:hypothetical protein